MTLEPQSVVFIVDDDVSIRDALGTLVRSVGLEVRTFTSGGEFLTTQLPDVPACLVLDVRLPGLSGLDLQSELGRAGVHIPIIFISGHGDIPMTVRAMKAGAVEFLPKPLREQDLLECHRPSHRQRSRRATAAGGSRRGPCAIREPDTAGK